MIFLWFRWVYILSHCQWSSSISGTSHYASLLPVPANIEPPPPQRTAVVGKLVAIALVHDSWQWQLHADILNYHNNVLEATVEWDRISVWYQNQWGESCNSATVVVPKMVYDSTNLQSGNMISPSHNNSCVFWIISTPDKATMVSLGKRYSGTAARHVLSLWRDPYSVTCRNLPSSKVGWCFTALQHIVLSIFCWVVTDIQETAKPKASCLPDKLFYTALSQSLMACPKFTLQVMSLALSCGWSVMGLIAYANNNSSKLLLIS